MLSGASGGMVVYAGCRSARATRRTPDIPLTFARRRPPSPCDRSAPMGIGASTMAIMVTPNEGSSPARPYVEGGLIWVLEDSPLEAEMARRAVAAQHTVEIFPDSPAMLERIANGSRPDTLVLDCQLPTMTGLEVCRFLRESFDEMDLPILMLTVQGHRADLIDGLSAGANDYLTKPYNVAELLARVGTLVRTRHL